MKNIIVSRFGSAGVVTQIIADKDMPVTAPGVQFEIVPSVEQLVNRGIPVGRARMIVHNWSTQPAINN